MTQLVVIPARWNSTRLPGKPLVPVAGHPLLTRTVDLARRATRGFSDIEIVVGTDDDRVADLARKLNVRAVLTDPSLTSGSARALAVARALSLADQGIINLQGDAPFIPPLAIASVVAALQNGAEVATPVAQLTWADLDRLRQHKKASPFSGTTCIVTAEGRAAWFSKQIIPAIRDEDRRRSLHALSPVFRHIGLYGYQMDALASFEQAAPTPYEQLEGLEQLRFLALGIPVKAVIVEADSWSMGGIDTYEDVRTAEQMIREHGDPYGT